MISLQSLMLIVLLGGPIVFLSWVVSRFLTGWSIALAHKKALLAEVNHRSSHTAPTPRVGGIGLTAGLLVGLLILAVMMALPVKDGLLLTIKPPAGAERSLTWLQWGGFTIAVLLAFALGLWDDRSNPPALAKLGGQLLIAFLPPVMGLRLMEIHLPGMQERLPLHFLAGIPLTAVWILFVMNAVNFMDGINGLAGRFGFWVVVFALLGVTGFGGWESLIILCAAAIGAVHGFLNYNLPVARTFMGDCGSQPLGVFIALLGVHLATVPTTYPLPLLGFVLIVSVFLYDVAYTLIKRASERKNVLQAHREHLYQRYLIATGEDHRGTLDMMEGYMIITGIAGGLYLHIAFDPAKTTRQLVLVAIAVAALVHYTIKVRRAEHRSGSELPGVAGSERISR